MKSGGINITLTIYNSENAGFPVSATDTCVATLANAYPTIAGRVMLTCSTLVVVHFTDLTLNAVLRKFFNIFQFVDLF